MLAASEVAVGSPEQQGALGVLDVTDKLLQPAETFTFFSFTANERRVTSGTRPSPDDTESHTVLSELYSQWSSPAQPSVSCTTFSLSRKAHL